MLKWAYNPELRAQSVPVTVEISEDVDIELTEIKEDPRYLTERRSPKKKVKNRSLTLSSASGRRNSFSMSIVKQGLKAMKLKKNLSNSALNINEADDELEEEEEADRTKETEEQTKKATITDIAKCHFSRVFEPDFGG